MNIYKFPYFIYLWIWWNITIKQNEFHFTLDIFYYKTDRRLIQIRNIVHHLDSKDWKNVWEMCSELNLKLLKEIVKSIHEAHNINYFKYMEGNR